MRGATKLTVRRPTAPRVERTAEELAELRETRERFQREKPTLDQVLAAAGREKATTLGEYLQAQELLLALRRERERQKLTLARLAERTGYDPAVLSRLFTGRQANTTLATLGRLAYALGKEVVRTLRDLPTTRVRPAGRKHAAAEPPGTKAPAEPRPPLNNRVLGRRQPPRR